jgi:hypothetical protein
MTTRSWNTGTSGSYLSNASWQGDVAPGPADTGVVSNAASASAPTESGAILTPGDGSSQAFLLAGTSLSTVTEGSTKIDGVTEAFFTTPTQSAAEQADAGETLAGGTLDLIGGGAEVALRLQNSTVKAGTTINVNGDAYVSAGYTNTLSGAIDIGLPFSVSGAAKTQGKADALGYTSALYLDVQPWGSWTGATVLASYIPTTTNRGAITVANGAALVINLEAEASGVLELSRTQAVSLPPERSQFANSGSIVIEAGGTLSSAVGGDNPDIVNTDFVNTDGIRLDGAAGKTTKAIIDTNLTGAGGRVDIDGGTQTVLTDTFVKIEGQVAGQNFALDGGGLALAPADVNASGFTYSGGIVDFEAGHGILDIAAPIEVNVSKLFGDTVSGFAAGDQIDLSYFLTSQPDWKPEVVWTQTKAASGTLELFNVLTTAGVESTTLEASFTLDGVYTDSSFKVVGTASNSPTSPVSVVITTSQTTVAAAAAASRFVQAMAAFDGGAASAMISEPPPVSHAPLGVPLLAVSAHAV